MTLPSVGYCCLPSLAGGALNGRPVPPHPDPLPQSFLLPTFSCSFSMANFPHHRQIIEALESAPERNWSGFSIALAGQKSAQPRGPAYKLADRRSFFRYRALAKGYAVQRLPFVFAEPITGRGVGYL